NSLEDAVNAVHSGYVQAQSAVVNYGDSFFNNPQSANPTLNVRAQSNSIQLDIDDERLQISTVLTDWQDENSGATTANVAGLISDSEGYTATIKGFLTDLSAIINGLTPGNSGLPQSAIDQDVSTMN